MTDKKVEVEELSFFEKMLEIISELKAPKNQYNDYGKFSYRSAEDILEGVKPLALTRGLLPNLTDEMVAIDGRYYVKATASITDGKDTLSATGYAREPQSKKGMDESQITGTASSYARKYAMNGLYLIDDTKDADTPEFASQTNNGQVDNGKATAKQVGLLKSKIMEYCNLKNGDQEQFEDFLSQQYNVANIYETNKQTTSNMIDFVVSKLPQG